MKTVYAIFGLLLIVGGLGATKADQIRSLIEFGEQAKENGPPPETVATSVVDAQPVQRTHDAVGSISSGRGITVTTEVAGIVTDIRFDSGDEVERGDVLVRLDTRVERAQLAQAKARAGLAETSLTRSRALVGKGATPQSVLDADESGYASATAEVAALRAQLAKKTIRAPFDGRLGIRLVDDGEYVSPGTALTSLEGREETFVDFTLPQELLPALDVGMPVTVRVDAEGGQRTLQGELAAIDPAIERATRSIKLRASLPTDEQLRPGMFVGVSVVDGDPVTRVMVPQTAIVRASYGDSVFVVEPKPEDEPGLRQTKDGYTVMVARQQFVSLGTTRGDFVAVLDGLEQGQQVVTAGAFKLRNGSPIVINEEGAPTPERDPTVENR
ncbi:MAG: efflux RND transporter periplasmic adaptor subunit [Nannocystaceae bacterium]|nr:efflux RND transporter periplasmic adaptor subunit [bacterium]